MKAVLPAFSGYGIELEYMIVDRESLSILPIADELLHMLAGEYVTEVECGRLAWSNELVLHLLELKNTHPEPNIESLPPLFQSEIQRINRELESMHARLMPSAMHPWMNPRVETRLWPHDHAEIYRAYDRIFDCKRHGWANLQSMHLNMPFADDTEFARLHAAIRLVLPILPALAASSPIAEGHHTGFLDDRLENYLTHQMKIPSTMGKVVPDTITSRAMYETQILNPMYREIATLDSEGVLQHEWLNVRGAVARFMRNAIEIRLIDVQECPAADLVIAAVVHDSVHALYDQQTASLADQQAISTDSLVKILHDCIRDAEQTRITDQEYLGLMDFPAQYCEARELWQHLIASAMSEQKIQPWQDALTIILEQGPLARRILRAVDQDFSQARLKTVYRELCDCLHEGRQFLRVS
ncbi:glutamate-cysteine ligase family protein [Nitrosomonas sp. Is37]|uniref:carboxylate-amine ligase n=1 Tax=Nitrosomonas sp. Is37 TaxID=3080535 RepID=UPI00294AC5C1|nr:glutamate-cysteine ligase family protein [Nitrosomonas sp. Is37]MDV6345622.1 glutamate-cysteine ligase family protein [Nitrosomonas sp. Is37]